jgi:hypothetical protein
MPPEVYLEILSNIDPITSVCLGLTCKKFYGIHWDEHGKVPLKLGHDSIGPESGPMILVNLGNLLRSWLQGTDLLWEPNAFRGFGNHFQASVKPRFLSGPECDQHRATRIRERIAELRGQQVEQNYAHEFWPLRLRARGGWWAPAAKGLQARLELEIRALEYHQARRWIQRLEWTLENALEKNNMYKDALNRSQLQVGTISNLFYDMFQKMLRERMLNRSLQDEAEVKDRCIDGLKAQVQRSKLALHRLQSELSPRVPSMEMVDKLHRAEEYSVNITKAFRREEEQAGKFREQARNLEHENRQLRELVAKLSKTKTT